MASSFSLSGRVALLTGANTGVGKEIALAMAGAGGEVICAGRSSCDDTAAAITRHGGRGVAPMLDVGGPVAGLGETGPMDILVNNGGIIRRADTIDFTGSDWDALMVNLKAAVFRCQSFARVAFACGAGGSIVNIASLLSFQGGIRVPSYTALKNGVAGLTKLLANKWAAKRINVSAIAPGCIVTNSTEALRADPVRNKAILERIPPRHCGEAADIGGAAVFLASLAASYDHGGR